TIDSLHRRLNIGYKASRDIARFAKPLRYGYNDKSSQWINPIKDTIGQNNQVNEKINRTLNHAYDSLLSLKDSVVNFYNLTFTENHKKQLKDLKGLKRSSMKNLNEEEDYMVAAVDLIANYSVMISVYDSIIKIDQQRLPELERYIGWNKKTIKQLKREIKLEYKRFHIHNWHYRHYNIFYKRQANSLKRLVTNRITTTKQEIRYLKEKIKERDRLLKQSE
ncbi:MAG: hypothetical protein JKY50_22050, partial [Oleispira sp.]|nr:hypothetical protein [Oleispira sp.]